MTIGKCLSICREEGFPYSGLKQTKCHCGVEPENGFQWVKWPSMCGNECSGDASQKCGGPNAMNVWTTPPANLNGFCIKDYHGENRVLNEKKRMNLKTLAIRRCYNICKVTGCYFSN